MAGLQTDADSATWRFASFDSSRATKSSWRLTTCALCTRSSRGTMRSSSESALKGAFVAASRLFFFSKWMTGSTGLLNNETLKGTVAANEIQRLRAKISELEERLAPANEARKESQVASS